MPTFNNWEVVDTLQKRMSVNLATREKVASAIERWRNTFNFTDKDLEGATVTYYVRGRQKYSRRSEQATYVSFTVKKGKWIISETGRTWLKECPWCIELKTELSEEMKQKAIAAAKRF